ncbi:MAG: hypothetical protein QCH35_08110 [Methanomicrobiaceae archaeon]|nr:hypothetical protein [Methanomicrobiaceae archaeon]
MASLLPPPRLAATGVGGLPHTDPGAACRAVLESFPEVPYAPTLPNRGPREAIVFNDAEHLPGAVVEGEKLFADTAADHSGQMEQIMLDYMEGNFAAYGASEEYNSGFLAMLECDLSGALFAKAQVTGPLTFGMQVVDREKRPLHYDPEYADLLNKMIALRARWYEERLIARTGAPHTLVVLNEPYLAAFGSSVIPVNRDLVAAGFEETATLLEGGIGVHCCSNTDWAFVLGMDIGFVSLDAYRYAREFLLYRDAIARFMEAGGVVAWGIVPAEYDVYEEETPDSLYTRMSAIRDEVCSWLDPELFARQSMITPTCGIRFADERGAGAIMGTAADLSRRAREEWA